MRIHLNFIERFGIMHIINNTQNASMRDWRAIDEMRKLLDFTQEDIKKFNIRPTKGGGINYDTKFVHEKVTFTIPDTGFAWLRNTLVHLDSQGLIHRELRPLAELIFNPEQEAPKKEEKPKKKRERKKA